VEECRKTRGLTGIRWPGRRLRKETGLVGKRGHRLELEENAIGCGPNPFATVVTQYEGKPIKQGLEGLFSRQKYHHQPVLLSFSPSSYLPGAVLAAFIPLGCGRSGWVWIDNQ